MKRASLLLLWLILISIQPSTVLAQSAPSCSFQPDGSISCTVGGGGGEEGEEENGNENPTETACVPGQHMTYPVFSYDPASSTCMVSPVMVDNCTGTPMESWSILTKVPCSPQGAGSSPQHPCTDFSIGAVVSLVPMEAGTSQRESLFPKSIWMYVPTPQLWCAGRPLSEMAACQSLPDQVV